MSVQVFHATRSPQVNLATVGAPYILVPEEARLNVGTNGIPRHVVAVPPLGGAVGGPVTLTWKCPADSDFYIQFVTCILWQIVTPQPPAGPYLNWVAPQQCIASPVRFRFLDQDSQVYESDGFHHWTAISGRAETPFYYGLPRYLPAGFSISAEIQNTSDADFAISLQLHGVRKIAARDLQSPRFQEMIGRTGEESFNSAGANRELVASERINYLGAGVSHAMMVPKPGDWPASLGVLTPGSYAAPARMPTLSLYNDATYTTLIRHVKASMAPRAPTACGAQVNIPDVDLQLHWPTFVQVRDMRNEYYLSNSHVPLAALAGWAGQPMLLPVDWSLGNNGTRLLIDVDNLAYNPLSAAEGLRFNLMFEGWQLGAAGR